jgi:hypothetical protein
MPRSCSMLIQSEVAWGPFLPFTLPATVIALPSSSSFSVIVVLPASGWEMMAKVRRCPIAADMSCWFMLRGSSRRRAGRGVTAGRGARMIPIALPRTKPARRRRL